MVKEAVDVLEDKMRTQEAEIGQGKIEIERLQKELESITQGMVNAETRRVEAEAKTAEAWESVTKMGHMMEEGTRMWAETAENMESLKEKEALIALTNCHVTYTSYSPNTGAGQGAE